MLASLAPLGEFCSFFFLFFKCPLSCTHLPPHAHTHSLTYMTPSNLQLPLSKGEDARGLASLAGPSRGSSGAFPTFSPRAHCYRKASGLWPERMLGPRCFYQPGPKSVEPWSSGAFFFFFFNLHVTLYPEQVVSESWSGQRGC